MRIKELALKEKQSIFCKNSKETYFNFDDGLNDYSGYKSMTAFWIDELIDEPTFNDISLEQAWLVYCEEHENTLDEEGLDFNFIISFLKKQKNDYLQALYCSFATDISSWSCLLVINEDYEIRKY